MFRSQIFFLFLIINISLFSQGIKSISEINQAFKVLPVSDSNKLNPLKFSVQIGEFNKLIDSGGVLHELYNRIKRLPNDHQEHWPFDKSFHLILNQAVGGDWGGRLGVDTSFYPQDFIIESVRLFDKMPKKKS